MSSVRAKPGTEIHCRPAGAASNTMLNVQFLFAMLVNICWATTSEFLDFHNKNVSVSLSENLGVSSNVFSNTSSMCGAELKSTKSMGFLLNQSYSGDLDVELAYTCFTLPQPNAYQAILNLILAGPEFSFSSPNSGVLGQYSVKMHSSIDFTWLTLSNRTYTENGGRGPRMIDGKIRLERRGLAIVGYFWYNGAWTKLNNMGSVPATLSGPLRVGIFIDLDWTSSYSISLGSILVMTDRDGDGVLDDAEALIGTDPAQADTDRDGLSDADDPRPLDAGVAFEVLVAHAPPWNGTAGAKPPGLRARNREAAAEK